MRAVIYTGAGGPEVISIGEVPKPEVRPGHIRVRVHAAGLNRADLIQRRGQYAAPPGWPADIPGLEYAGDVEAVRGASRWKVGDRVMGLVGGGAQAELVAVHEDEVLPIPAGLSYAEAAAIPEVFLTAYDALVTRGRLAAGRTGPDPRGGKRSRHRRRADRQAPRRHGARHLAQRRQAGPRARSTASTRASTRAAPASAMPWAIRCDVVLDVLGGPAFADNLHVLGASRPTRVARVPGGQPHDRPTSARSSASDSRSSAP